MSRFAPGIAAFVAAISVALFGLYARADAPEPDAPKTGVAKLRLLGVNDFHGHLEPPEPGVGGAAWLKSHLDRAELPGRTIRVHAGDMVGASPLISGWFHDEPSVEAGNELGFDVGTLGNHEFDEGGDELLRLLRGGRRKGPGAFKRDVDGRLVNTSGPDFRGTTYPYIAANTRTRDGETLLPPFAIEERDGVKVGFIGVTTTSTPHFVLPRHASRFEFTDISGAVNRWVPELRRRGVEAIVVLAHEGAPDGSGGEIIDEARQMDAAVDVVIAGHSHSFLNLEVGSKLVIEARSYGRAFDLVDLEVDRRSGDVVKKSGALPATEHAGVAPDEAMGALVGRYAERVRPLGDHVVGETPRALPRGPRLGRMIAAAHRWVAGADAAVASHASMRGEIDAGPITYAEVAEAQGYDHRVMRFTVTGAELARLRERAGGGALYYAGPRAALDPGARYTVAANEMLATGGGLGEPYDGRPVSNEVEALGRWLERGLAAPR